MTTIAYRDGILAADRLAQLDGAVSGLVTKVQVPVADGIYRAVGIAGTLAELQRVMWWANTENEFGDTPQALPPPKLSAGTVALLIDASGDVGYLEEDAEALITIDAPFHARGSGREFALGAMAQGATAIEAVQVAARFDTKTGGGVDWINVLTGETGSIPA